MPDAVRVVDAPADPTDVAAFLPQLSAALDGSGPALLPLPAGPQSLRDDLIARADPTCPLDHPDIALVVATSGTTGRPKLAMLSRHALVASADATHHALGGPGRWLLALPTTHIAGLQVLTRSIVSGFPPVAMDLRRGFNVAHLIDAVGTLLDDIGPEPRYTALVPTQLRRVLDAGGVAVQALVALDAVLLGGAAAPDDLVQSAHAAGITLVRTYGMTETCGGCVYDGVPLPGVTVNVRPDRRIQLSGAMLFSGYRGDENLTRQVLHDGVLTTNDFGHLDEHRRLHVVGRVEHVIVSGGENVDAIAVEQEISKHPNVQQVVVVGVPDEAWGERVQLVCVLSEPLTVDDLRDFGRSSLPESSLPRAIVSLDALPLLPSGQPDRSAIRAAAAGDNA